MLKIYIIAFVNVTIIFFGGQIVQFGSVPPTVFHALKIGAGGFLHNLDIQCDRGIGRCAGTGTTTKVARTDTYGAYWYNPNATNCGNAAATGCWQQLITVASFSDSLFNICFAACGVYEIRIAPSNTSHIYMYGPNGNVYGSTNKGATWKRTSFVNVAVNSNDQGTASFGPYMAVDPVNENVVIAGTPSGGAFYTTNGGTSWVQISGLCTPSTPSGAGQGGGYLIAFDPTTSSGGSTPGIYISCYGTGVYHTLGGVSGAFTLTKGTPTTHQHMVIDSAGSLYLVDNGNDYNINVYAGGSWTSYSVGSGGYGPVNSVAVDPSDNSKIVVQNVGGQISYTKTGPSGTWSQLTYNTSRTATDIPWLAKTNEAYMSAGNIIYDPAQSNVLYFAEGIGVWYTSPGSYPLAAWTSQSAAIEQLAAIWIISPPTSAGSTDGYPFLTAADRPGWQITATTQPYPPNHSINDNSGDARAAIVWGFSADWCSSASGTIALLAQGLSNNVEYSGISTTGGTYNSWTLFTSLGTPPRNSSTTHKGGTMACSTPGNIVWMLGNNGGLYYTINGGASWLPSSTGLAMSDFGWNLSYQYDRQNVIADRVNAHTFYAYNSGSRCPRHL